MRNMVGEAPRLAKRGGTPRLLWIAKGFCKSLTRIRKRGRPARIATSGRDARAPVVASPIAPKDGRGATHAAEVLQEPQ